MSTEREKILERNLTILSEQFTECRRARDRYERERDEARAWARRLAKSTLEFAEDLDEVSEFDALPWAKDETAP